MRTFTRVVAIVALLVTLSSVMAGSAAAARRPHRPDKVYLSLGDSLQAGEGASDPSNSLAPLFFQYLDNIDAADQLVSVAVPGETSSTLRAGKHSQLAQALAAIKDPRTDVTVVTLGIGGNDVPFDICIPAPTSQECLDANHVAMSGLARNLDRTLRQLKQALARDPGTEQVILTTYYQPLGGTGDPGEDGFDVLWQGADLKVNCGANAGHPENVGLNDVITCVGARYGATIVDLYPLFDDHALELTHIGEGDLHPNDDGYALIAGALIDAYGD